MTSTRLRTTKRASAVALALVAGSTGLIASAGAASATDWDAVAQCESGGNWSTNTGNGFGGGLQFTDSTWAANGGSGSPEGASRSEQIRVAENVKQSQGMGAWPVCGSNGGSSSSSSSGSSSSDSERSSRSTERQSVAPSSSSSSSDSSSSSSSTSSAPTVERTVYLSTDLENQVRGDVKELQNNLVEVSHFNIAVDGQYGPQTEGAVKALQERNGLEADGVAGPETLGLYNG
jgi:hypothetical protein